MLTKLQYYGVLLSIITFVTRKGTQDLGETEENVMFCKHDFEHLLI